VDPADAPAPRPAAGLRLRDRLLWDASAGRVADGPRRYLLMRPDVLMGALRRLPPPARAQMMEAFADSVAEHGIDSIRAYFREVHEDPAALLRATVQAAADLGWGAWRFDPAPGVLGLEVSGSPFADGHGPADAPVCAPLRGMLRAVAEVGTGMAVAVVERQCVACGAPHCVFEARWACC
jgi:hypothetical protein